MLAIRNICKLITPLKGSDIDEDSFIFTIEIFDKIIMSLNSKIIDSKETTLLFNNLNLLISAKNSGLIELKDFIFLLNIFNELIGALLSRKIRIDEFILEWNKKFNQYLPFNNLIELDNNKGIIGLLNENNSKLLGILGIIILFAGAIYTIRKKENKKKKVPNEEEIIEETIEKMKNEDETSVYGIYEILSDKNDNVSEVRVSKEDSKDELWIQL